MNDTDNTNTAPENEVRNPGALLAKNRALLGELAQLKADLESARTALANEKQRADTLGADLHEMRVVRPWQSLLTDIAADGHAGMLARALGDYLDVVAGADGGPELRDKEGQPLLLKNRQLVTPESLRDWIHEHGESGNFDDLRPLLARARGMGAAGGHARTWTPPTPEAAPAPQRTAYGLR